MVKNSGATFKQVSVSFQRGKVHICGGFLGKYMDTTTKQEKDLDGTSYEFVKVTCGEPWLVHAVSRCSRLTHSAMSRTTLVGDLLKHISATAFTTTSKLVWHGPFPCGPISKPNR